MVALLLLAAFLREDFVFTLLYLLAGAYAIGRWWSRKALRNVKAQRSFEPRAFLEEVVPVQLSLANASWLPVVWLHVHDALPVELTTPNFFRRVISLGPYEHVRLEYQLKARKRGFYPIGPLSAYSGDIFGLADRCKVEGPLAYLTVYPRIIPLTRVRLPSHSPMGTLRHSQPIYEDPSRVLGKRAYIAGDSLRRVDWKSSATSGQLQVKLFEPSISLETAIFLDLKATDYDQRVRYPSTELAIVVAASLASWVTGKQQAVGLVTNGCDPLSESGTAQSIPARKGRGHLMRILDVLARIQAGEAETFASLIGREAHHLPWGTTLIIIGGQAEPDLFEQLFQARRAGQDALLVLCGPVEGYREIERRAAQFDFPVFQLFNEQDLDVWR